MDGHIDIRNHVNTSQDLNSLSSYRIWELELHCHEYGAAYTVIKDYKDFLNSTCACLLLYYDCGYLEIYVKNSDDFQDIFEYLTSISAKHLTVKTSKNDSRTVLGL